MINNDGNFYTESSHDYISIDYMIPSSDADVLTYAEERQQSEVGSEVPAVWLMYVLCKTTTSEIL